MCLSPAAKRLHLVHAADCYCYNLFFILKLFNFVFALKVFAEANINSFENKMSLHLSTLKISL